LFHFSMPQNTPLYDLSRELAAITLSLRYINNILTDAS
jgi:hypothetical protein